MRAREEAGCCGRPKHVSHLQAVSEFGSWEGKGCFAESSLCGRLAAGARGEALGLVGRGVRCSGTTVQQPGRRGEEMGDGRWE